MIFFLNKALDKAIISTSGDKIMTEQQLEKIISAEKALDCEDNILSHISSYLPR